MLEHANQKKRATAMHRSNTGWLVLMLSCSVLAFDVGWGQGRADPPTQDKPLGEDPLALDAAGDPLPDGAVVRLGSSGGRPGGSLRFSADGKSLLAAGGANQDTIYLRDGLTGKALRRFELPSRVDEFCDFSPDLETVIVVDRRDRGEPGFIGREVATGKEVGRYTTAPGRSSIAAKYSPDGTLLATSTGDRVKPCVTVWETRTNKKLCELPMPADCSDFEFSTDGQTLLTAQRRQDLIVDHWQARTGKKNHSIAVPGSSYVGVSFSPNGTLLALIVSQGGGTVLKVVDGTTGKDLYTMPTQLGFTCFSPQGDLLVVPDKKGFRILESRTGKERIHAERGGHKLVFSPDGRRLASAISANAIGLWEVETGRDLHPYATGHGLVTDLALSPDGKSLYAAAGLGTITIWDLNKRSLQHRLERADQQGKLDFLHHGRLLASSTPDGILRFWDPVNVKERDQIALTGQVIAMDLAPDGKTLAMLSVKQQKVFEDIELHLWDVANKKRQPGPSFKLGRFKFDGVRESAVAFSPDGKLLALNDDRQVFLWQLGSDQKRLACAGEYHKPSAFRFSPDGRLLAAICGHECQLWSVDTGAKRLQIKVAIDSRTTDAPSGLTFSPDSRLLVTGHYLAIHIWELVSGQERWVLKSGARALAFSADQSFLYSGGEDGAILLWSMKNLAQRGRLADAKLKPAELEGLWIELGGQARPAFVAQQRLALDSKATIPFLAERLKSKPVNAERLKKLIGDLGAEAFTVREAADTELRRIGGAAEEALRQNLRGNTNLEMQNRVAAILKQLERSPEALREARAVELLERIGTEGAQRLLSDLVKEPPNPRLGQQAQESLSRLKNAVTASG
jgi:WD40 repeat protein